MTDQLMNIYNNPGRGEWEMLLKRPYVDNTAVMDVAGMILNSVKQNGDASLSEFVKRFDKVELERLDVIPSELLNAEKSIPATLKAAIIQAKENIERFHYAQMAEPEVIETQPGINCWRKNVGIEKVGLYIPGGTAPLFSTVLMLGVPAKLAGCKEIILCTPSNAEGQIHPAILYAAGLVGITKIFKIGGAQAIAAMAYGTETIPKAYKIFGPGNQYVTAAKQLVQMEGIAIDMPAGPSEVCVLADETADPEFVAADLLSQAEHGVDSQVLLVSNNENTLFKCLDALKNQLNQLPRKDLAQKALMGSKAIVLNQLDDAIALVNEYAAEHLIINCQNAEHIADRITNAGSVFIGPYSPESVGDYASGTNHTLPTNGYAKMYSGVSLDSFVKKITYQRLTKQGLQEIGNTVIQMAEAEGLQAHANAVTIRLSSF